MLCAILLPPVPEVEDLSSALHCLILSWDDTQRMSLGSHLCELGFLQLVVCTDASGARGFQTQRETLL